MDQDLELAELSGTVNAVIFKNEENGYTVLRMTTSDGELVTVVGCFPYASAGEDLVVSGSWTSHAVHGRQFKAEFAQRLLPSTANAIYDFLSGGAVRGIGPAMAAMIVSEFGEKSLDVLESSPEKLAKIRGISASRAEQMCRSFRRQMGLRRLMEFVCSFGLRPILAMRMYKFYGDQALDLLRSNPYLLASEHIGGSFREADFMANELGIDSGSAQRIEAAVLFELNHNTGNGHCFIPREKLAAVTAELIDVEPERADESIQALIENGRLCYEEIAGCRACYLPPLYEAEKGTAERLARMCRRRFDERTDTTALIDRLEKQIGMKYAPLQRKTLELALKNQLLVITGGPGTGKTTSIRAILALFDQRGMKTLLTAPTGRAAKRMSELTGCEAATIHRLLEAKFADDGETVVFSKGINDPLDCDAVILDECSMVDISLMYALLSAIPEDARLILVGDADQLPSVGPGNVFSAVIRSEAVQTVRLTEIFRQKAESRIVRNAHMINRGEHPDFSENAGDFFRLRRLQAAGTVETVTELCSVRLPGRMHIPPEEIQVLSPTRKGELGTLRLNKELQAALNPADQGKKEKAFGDVIFREGDRVMQIRNNYDITLKDKDGRVRGNGVFNGDIGKITEIDPDAETLTVEYDNGLAAYGFDSLLELEHAWAMTVHKAQGSEFRAVLLVLNPAAQALLTRSVLYTAVTRAKELMILIGDDQTAYAMIDQYRQTRRYNALRVRLRKLCGIDA
ncbi:MAG: ATP-dependent RecD-like DNA helicase [Oscillospiraceae bacterium]|nr:ATP-dependent RecD-like DNA helicase [Oscillospiraceae bacterium]